MNTRALAALGLALAAAGCIDATPQLFVAGICGTPSDVVVCKPPGGKCDTFLNGHLQVFTTVRLAAAPAPVLVNFLTAVAEIHNNASPNNLPGVGRGNTLDAVIESATVSYAAAGLVIPTAVTKDLYTPVPAGSTATIFLPIMESATVTRFGASAEVVAEIKLGGHYMDGSKFETGPFQVPVDVIAANFDATAPCTDPTMTRFFCYFPGQTGGSKCAAPP